VHICLGNEGIYVQTGIVAINRFNEPPVSGPPIDFNLREGAAKPTYATPGIFSALAVLMSLIIA
jgi:hypothetical protein